METIHQETAGTALPRLREGLPPHLRTLLHHVLASQERDASVELDAGLDLLLSIDRVLCGGSGVVTTRTATTLASRVLSQSASLVVPGDAVATLRHLRAPFEQPFVDVPLSFSARRNHEGFVLELHVPNELRAARWMGSAALGYAKAATRFSGEGVARLRLYLEIVGDVARVLGRHTDSGVVSVPAPAATRDVRPMRRRSSPTNAAAQVDQILSRATPSAGLPAMDMKALLDARSRGVVRTSNPAEPSQAKPAPSESGTRPVAAEPGARPRKSAS
ncbi:MAG TPA: hypothetical protein VMG12_19080 [Polyangiaceae bacterium]|nr:hypothetical protein [Polyangiaceae bacterium]